MIYNPNERVRPVNIEDEMRESYINYAMSVIMARALPDVRDGLKPVQRRIIYVMHDLGLGPGRAFRKCAKIVGDALGKLHPHGDSSVYDALVRMAQDFSLRYPLVDGQGNFGSVDGDPAAAYRYTEARMTRVTEAVLTDIDKETVDFIPNFDGTEQEPTVLPSAVPNLLVNGSSGIAVGMSTNIPPHNLGETIDATIAMINNPAITVEELMKYLPGPDFPTGAYICGRRGLHKAYSTGRGHLIIRAAATIETAKGLKASIVVNQIPYQVNKARLIEEIAGLVQKKKIEGISDIRDESDKDGLRVVIDLKRGENAEVVLNQLYKHTRMQVTFGIILLAIDSGRPVYMTLPQLLGCFIDHRREVIIRRTRFLLDKAEKRAHILEGLRVAIRNIDEVIQIIRKAKDPDVARVRLMKRFNFTEIQAKAILEMRLQRLTNLEREKLDSEYNQLLKDIDEYRQILDSPARVMKMMTEELLEIKRRFGDPRRTVIVDAVDDLEVEDLIAEENMVITISHTGYIKRIATSTYRQQRRGGRGVTAMSTKETDFVEQLFVASTHHYILFFSNFGKAYWLKVYEIPQGGRAARGKAIVNLLQLEQGEKIEAFVPVVEFDDKHFLVMVSAKGVIKKTNLSAFSNPRRNGIIALSLDKGDELLEVAMSDGDSEVVIATKEGKAIRFHERDVRVMGRNARGVRAMTLKDSDRVIGMELCREDVTLLTVSENGFGKRTALSEYRKIRRGGQGVINIQMSERNGRSVGILTVYDEDELMIITEKGIAIRQPVADIRTISRNTQGVRLIRLDPNDRVMAVAKVREEDTEEDTEASPEDS